MANELNILKSPIPRDQMLYALAPEQRGPLLDGILPFQSTQRSTSLNSLQDMILQVIEFKTWSVYNYVCCNDVAYLQAINASSTIVPSSFGHRSPATSFNDRTELFEVHHAASNADHLTHRITAPYNVWSNHLSS